MYGTSLLRSLNASNPINFGHPLNHGLVNEYAVLPQCAGISGWGMNKWRDLNLLTNGKNNGTLTNFANPFTQTSGWIAQRRPGGFGSLAFDGTNDYALFTDATYLNGVTALTVALWVKPLSTGTYELWDRWCTGSNGVFFFKSRYDTSLGFRGFVSSTGANQDGGTFASTIVTAGTWNHACWTYDGTTLRFYLNGVASATTFSGIVSGALTGGASITAFGTNSNGAGASNQLNGAADMVSVWKNRALTAAEVYLLYNETRKGNPNRWNWRNRTSLFVGSQAAAASTQQQLMLLGCGA